MPFHESISDFLFGEGPSVDTQTLPTLTPEQQEALNELLRVLSAEGITPESFPGNLSTELTGGEQTSLAALEQRALNLADPEGLAASTTGTLQQLLDIEGGPSSTAEATSFFESAIRDPALRSFQETILPGISRDFGGSSFFGSERQNVDERAREDLIQSLTGARSDILFRTRESGLDRALGAAGIAPGVQGGFTNELLSILEGAGLPRRVEEANIGRQFGSFQADRAERSNRINAILAAAGLPAIENIVSVLGGSEGFLQAVASGAASNPAVLGG